MSFLKARFILTVSLFELGGWETLGGSIAVTERLNDAKMLFADQKNSGRISYR